MHARTMKRWLGAALLAALVGGCGGAAGKKSDSGPEPVVLTTGDLAVVTRTNVESGVPLQGTLHPLSDVTILAPFGDVIEEMMVREGQAVQRGQVLARMRTVSVAPVAASAEAQRRIAAADLQRMKNLLQEGAVAERDVEGAEAQLKAAEAAEAVAQKRLNESTVRAPFAGVIAQRFLQAGDRPGDGDRLFRIVNTDELEFAASVATEALDRLKPGAPVALTVSGLAGHQVMGRISRVNATVDEATRQVKVYVLVPNRDHALAGDMFASGRIVLDRAPGALAVPVNSVKAGSGSTAQAWVVSGGKLARRAITTGLHDELRDLVEVKSGVREGEKIIATQIDGLVDGQPVQLSRDTAPTTAPPQTPATPAAPPARAGRTVAAPQRAQTRPAAAGLAPAPGGGDAHTAPAARREK